MLSHQLPVLPPVDEFLAALDGLFAWLTGEEAVLLEPVPVGRETIEPSWSRPPTSRGGRVVPHSSRSALQA